MIRCNRCGTTNAAGVMNCQTCGEPLVSNMGYESGSHMGAQSGQNTMGMQGHPGQPEIPAWLETLRAGERGGMPPGSGANFSAADLVEEGALPSWMRPGRNDAGEASGPYLAIRSAAQPGPDTDDGNVAARGLLARSLIDEQALPSWMRDSKGGAETPPQPGSLNAASLLQPDSVPEWMKTVQQQQQQSSPSNMNVQGMPPMPSPSAQSWSAYPAAPLSSPAPMKMDEQKEMFTSPSGFSARDLIDAQALPSWMAQQGGQQTRGENPSGGISGPQAQAAFSASSLLDADSLPYWLRENGQSEQGSREQRSAPSSMPQPDQSSWQAGAAISPVVPLSPSSPMQVPGNAYGSGSQPAWSNPGVQAPGSSLAASSFIDMNSLPEWLRAASDPSQTGGAVQQRMGEGAPGPGQRPGGYQVPQRSENVNVRVPSRPRGEVNPSEGSEVAANVFASMLGVASAAPNFPVAGGQAGNTDAPYMNQSGQLPPSQGMPPQAAGMPDQMGGMPQGYGPGSYMQEGMQGQQSYSPSAYPQAYQQQGYPGGAPQQGYPPQGYSMGGAMGAPPNEMTPYSSTPGIPGAAGTPGMAPHPYQIPGGGMAGEMRNDKPAKRGFFEAIRDLFNFR